MTMALQGFFFSLFYFLMFQMQNKGYYQLLLFSNLGQITTNYSYYFILTYFPIADTRSLVRRTDAGCPITLKSQSFFCISLRFMDLTALSLGAGPGLAAARLKKPTKKQFADTFGPTCVNNLSRLNKQSHRSTPFFY